MSDFLGQIFDTVSPVLPFLFFLGGVGPCERYFWTALDVCVWAETYPRSGAGLESYFLTGWVGARHLLFHLLLSYFGPGFWGRA